MSAAQSAASATLVLDNGLRVRICHEPRLKRAAAFLRVDAGSHDVDLAWPGLAHFLEHLFFLGTTRFAGDQALMPFVQRHGGQLNASTRERTTDYFFEVPVPAFSGALERMCEMFANPRLSATDQRREREVLHAEFISWSRDNQAHHELWLTSPLSARHPLRAFHAGNRYSLPLERAEFQVALRQFHLDHYHSGQMTLTLVGPQPEDYLIRLAQRACAILPRGKPRLRPAPPPLLDGTGDAQPQAEGSRFNLAFACDELPEGAPAAVAFFSTWFANAQPGGLQAELLRRELIESMRVSAHYLYQGQALIDIEFTLTAHGQGHLPTLSALTFDWLEFFEAVDDWPMLREEYALLQRRQALTSGALALARRLAQPEEHAEVLDNQGLVALRALLAQLRPERVLHPLPKPSDAFVASAPGAHWRLPQRNRFLRPSRRPDQPVADIRAMRYAQGVDNSAHEAELLLRWNVGASHQAGLWQVLDRALQRLVHEARQAGVKVLFTSLGEDWQLRLSGVSEPMAPLLEQVLAVLNAPPPEVWRYAEPLTPPAQTPIRELLRQLPEHCLGNSRGSARHQPEDVQPGKLQKVWSVATWEGLALGFNDSSRSALNLALRAMPGHPDPQMAARARRMQGKRWSVLPAPGSEHALLLFCPAPPGSISEDAAWRLIAQIAQAPFYQRLRVELQLGYAVFSSFRQIAGLPGLVFGVQSPGTDQPALLGHFDQFLKQLPRLIGNLGSEKLLGQRQALINRLKPEEMDTSQLADTLWQAHLGSHDGDYLKRLQQAMGELRSTELVSAAWRLANADHGWLVLANGGEAPKGWEAMGTFLPER
ncbi:pyrroloquinoline quinone biosynthesis protein PqqF [Pseudomonas japonica]|uniref:pyrroloquinoline quinone biosynthesis protein PqqF n=1 Tax=Pseudomonas japonica TaxID=256466 RepID=UPI0015E37AED|nr:pyrroloquinoline quinone biosynthesis protein PqqF [Pseudomonas japonica]MBA1242964.1 pyrroloquinoline quinone biosynthesis protein PqqF [Pseudomonas japonica]